MDFDGEEGRKSKLGRFRIERQAQENIHADLGNASYYFMKRIAKREVENDLEGISLEMMAALTMTAFWIEAAVNYIGSIKVENWVERQRGDKKWKQVLAALNISPDFSKIPWSVVHELRVFRDTLAHGKPETLEHEEIVILPIGSAQRPDSLESSWVRSLTAETVIAAFNNTQTVWNEILEAAGISEIETGSHASYGMIFLGEVEEERSPQ